jgi:hypothetical protein
MNVSWKKILWGVALLPFVVALAWLIHLDRCSKGHADPVRHDHVEPLRIVVTDPLSLALADAHEALLGRELSSEDGPQPEEGGGR